MNVFSNNLTEKKGFHTVFTNQIVSISTEGASIYTFSHSKYSQFLNVLNYADFVEPTASSFDLFQKNSGINSLFAYIFSQFTAECETESV